IDASIASNLVHPGAEGGSRTVGLPIFQNSEEDVLYQVFTHGALACQLIKEIEQSHVIPFKQRTQHFAHTTAHLRHQLLIGHRLGHELLSGTAVLPFEDEYLSPEKRLHGINGPH